MRVFLANHAYTREDATHLVETWRSACVNDEVFDGSAVTVPNDTQFDCGIIHDQADKAAYIHDRRPNWGMWKHNAIVIFCSSVGVPTKPFFLQKPQENKRINVFGVHTPFGQVSKEEWQGLLLWVREALERDECKLDSMPSRVLHLVRPLSFDYVLALGLLCDAAKELGGDALTIDMTRQAQELARKKLTSPIWWRSALGVVPDASDVSEHVTYECEALSRAHECPESVGELVRAMQRTDEAALSRWVPRAHAAIQEVLMGQ